eukprot:2936820-Amphidinium_carterae.1
MSSAATAERSAHAMLLPTPGATHWKVRFWHSTKGWVPRHFVHTWRPLPHPRPCTEHFLKL